MNKVIIAGKVNTVKEFNGKTKFCYATIEMPTGKKMSVSAFDKIAENLQKNIYKNVMVTGYLQNVKDEKTGTYSLRITATTCDPLLETNTLNNQKTQENKQFEEIPF